MMVHTDMEQPELGRIVTSSSRVEVIAHGMLFGEGPVWHAAEGTLYWVDIMKDTIWKWTPGVGQAVVMRPSGRANGMTLDAKRRRVVAGWSTRTIWRVEHDGSIVTIADSYEGKKLNTPNDIVVKSDGSIYWTDPSGALFIPGMEGEDLQRYIDTHPVLRLSPDGDEVSLVTDELQYPNGLAFSPDESILYVADTWGHTVVAYDVLEDGSVAVPGRVFYSLVGDEPRRADGVKLDVEGNVYVTGPGGIHVISPAGKLIGRLLFEGHVANMAWGDDDWHSLYVTGREKVYRVRLGIQGVAVCPIKEDSQ